MGLLQNISMLSAEPIRNIGGAAGQCIIRSSNNRAEQQLNKFVSLAGMDTKGGVPYGYVHPIAITMPIKEGGMSSYSGVVGTGVTTNSLNMGINLGSSILGISTFIPMLTGLAELISNVSGTGSLPTPTLQCPLCLGPSTLYGQGITTSQATALAKCSSTVQGAGRFSTVEMQILTLMLSNLVGTGGLNSVLDMTAFLVTQLQGNGSLDGVTLSALQQLLSEVRGSGEVTSSQIETISKCYATLTGNSSIALVDLQSITQLAGNLVGIGHVGCALDLIIFITSILQGAGQVNSTVKTLQEFSAVISGQGTVQSGILGLLLDFVASLYGNGDVSTGLNILILVAASVMGHSTIVTDLSPLAKMAASLNGDSTITQAQIKAISVLVSNLNGIGMVSVADIRTLAFMVSNILNSGNIDTTVFCKCFMDAEITQVGEMVTPQSCAQAVWSALAAAFNESGTMGSKVNSASAAGDPWTAELPGTYAEGSAGDLLDKIRRLIKDNQALILTK